MLRGGGPIEKNYDLKYTTVTNIYKIIRGVTVQKNRGSVRTSVLRSQFSSFSVQ